MSSPLQIAVAKRTAAMAAQLAVFGRQAFYDTFAADNTPEDMAAYLDESFGEAQQLAELHDPNTVFLLARMQQELVASAKLRFGSTLALAPGKSADTQLEISRLYVRKDWIGTGLGAALMRRIIEEARAKGCRSIVLGVWERNERAIAFYQRFGFKTIGNMDFMLGKDLQNDLILRKGL
ncbi:GNAT family N-acetyltransferase [Hymenobacter crusticola]|nr:GNAT family N-acetyltransferase [Hymenobacter crusticola]